MRDLPFVTIKEILTDDPCLPLLGTVFRCVDDEFDSPDRVGEVFGTAPEESGEYLLTEIHFSTQGFVGNFREFPPCAHHYGFQLRRFETLTGPHPNSFPSGPEKSRISRAKFALREYQPPGLDSVLYTEILRPEDQLPVFVYNFEPRILEYPVTPFPHL